MKTKNNDNEVVTRGILREAFNEFGKQFAATFGAELLSKIGIMIDTKIDAKLDKSIGDLAIMIQAGFMATAKQEDLLALTERVTGVEGRLDSHDKQFKKINDKLDATLSEVKQVRI